MGKPFNLADAKAGHPVQCSNGQTATILKFDGAVFTLPLIGVVGPDDAMHRWTDNGRPDVSCMGIPHHYDLVMAPIGTIDGKPVYPGDMITSGGDPFPAPHGSPIPAGTKWPRVYPETQMAEEMLRDKLKTSVTYAAVANAAIRHGIDNGYLLDPREQQAISIKLPDLSPEELGRLMSGDTGRESILYDQGPITYGNLQKVATALGIHRCDTFDDVKDKIKRRERAIMRQGLSAGIALKNMGWESVQIYTMDDDTIDFYLAKVK